jgi:hypothetical protein
MGVASTIFFSLIGFTSFLAGVLLVSSSAGNFLRVVLLDAERQEHYSRIIDSFPVEIYSRTDIGNMRRTRSELMVEALILRDKLTQAVNYIDEIPDSLEGQILHYNFIDVLLKYFKMFNRQVDKLLRAFPSTPDQTNEPGK